MDDCIYTMCIVYPMCIHHTESLSESSEDGGEGGGDKASGKVGEAMEVGRNTPTILLKGTVYAITRTMYIYTILYSVNKWISNIACHTCNYSLCVYIHCTCVHVRTQVT